LTKAIEEAKELPDLMPELDQPEVTEEIDEPQTPTPEDKIEIPSESKIDASREVLFSPAPDDDAMAVLHFVCTPTELDYAGVKLLCYSRADYKDAMGAVLVARRLNAVGQKHDVVNDFIARRSKRLLSENPEGKA